MFGSDANWGRILSAIGRNKDIDRIDKVKIQLNGEPLVKQGYIDAKYSEKRASNEILGMSVSFIIPGQQLDERKTAYEADVIYATNNELGFDFLRNNMVVNTNDRMMNDYYFAIIDEITI